MTTLCRNIVRLCAGCSLLLSVVCGLAQDDAPRRARKSRDVLRVEPSTPEERTVEAILETKPEQPDELVRAIDILIDLGYPAAAKPLLAKLKEAELGPTELAALGRQFGLAVFLKMSSAEELQPDAGEFAESVRAAVRDYAHDPQTIQNWIKQLSSPDPEVRSQAIVDLRGSGTDGLAALIRVLADAGRQAEHKAVGEAILAQGEDVAAPVLISTLDSSDTRLKAQAIGLLSRLNSQQASPFLLAPAVWPQSDLPVRTAAEDALERLLGSVPPLDEAATLLYNRARSHYELTRPLHPDLNDLVEVWSWDDAKKTPVSRRILSADASLVLAARLSRDLDLLLPHSRAATRLYLGSQLEAESFQNGLDRPLPRGAGTAFAVAALRGPAAIYDLLQDAVATNRPRTAALALEVLAEIGSSELLHQEGSRLSAVVRALHSPDRRLRFAALAAIMRYQPTQPFAGSSEVLDSLVYFVGAAGSPRALVADTSFVEAQNMAGLLRELGFEVDIATTSDELLKVASVMPHEMAVVDIALPRWPIDQVLQRLRRDGHSGAMPVGLIAPLDADDRPEILARRDPLVQVWVRPVDPFGMQVQADRLLALIGRNRVTDAERAAHASQSLVWLGELAAQQDSLYELRRGEEAAIRSLDDPDLVAAAVALLKELPTPGAQRALVDQASLTVLPLPIRQNAARAFQQSLVKHGPLLTSEEINLQYERYNQSELLDAQTQELLGFILDCLEAGRTMPENVPAGTLETESLQD
ncbi:MAG: response regulator [Pirellulales bacterium]